MTPGGEVADSLREPVNPLRPLSWMVAVPTEGLVRVNGFGVADIRKLVQMFVPVMTKEIEPCPLIPVSSITVSKTEASTRTPDDWSQARPISIVPVGLESV